MPKKGKKVGMLSGSEQLMHSSLASLEMVSQRTELGSDKPTRKMLNRIKDTIMPLFQLQMTNGGIKYQDLRFVEVCSPEGLQTNLMVRAAQGFGPQPDQPITLITGMCLFGTSDLSAMTDQGQSLSLNDRRKLIELEGQRLATIECQQDLHPSEVENLTRLLQGIRVLTSAQKTDHLIKCYWHLPGPEYALYMLNLYYHHVLSRAQLFEVLENIRQRVSGLANIVRKRVPAGVSVQFFSPIEPYLPQLMETDGSMASVIKILESDHTFSRMLSHSSPQNLGQLADLSFTAAYLHLAETAKKRNENALALETFEERPILEEAEKISNSMGQGLNLAALYLPPVAVSLDEHSVAQDLFRHRVGSRGDRLQDIKQIIRSSRGKII